jgi:hypothetical protein
MPTISESDWKLYRQVHALALQRFCERVLSELSRVGAAKRKTAHERYLAVYKRLQRRDKELAEAFDHLRRSTAWRQLALMRSWGLVTDEEFARFSPETQGAVQLFIGA